jgi:adenosine kinase
MLATLVIESVGTQEYGFAPTEFGRRVEDAYGADAAAQIEPMIRPAGGAE